MGAQPGYIGPAETLSLYFGAFIDELVAAGLRDVCLCPGSRSTPLAILSSQHPEIKTWLHLDERSCAYFALGMAKASGRPVAILCTSGTASYNFAPAVAEASTSQVPLIVLTSDRPQELRDLGANQTIDQVRLYGSHVKWFVEVPLPEATGPALRYARMVASRTIATALSDPAGPVHLNFPLREPLLPAAYQPSGKSGQQQVSAHPVRHGVSPDDVTATVGLIKSSSCGVIVCGQQEDEAFPPAVAALAERLGYPILADPLSQVRNGAHFSPSILSAYDAFIRQDSLAGQLAPDLILRFGAPPTSKPLATYLQRYRQTTQVLVSPPGLWRDPDLTASSMIYGDAADFCQQLLLSLDGAEVRLDEAWLPAWIEAETASQSAFDAVLAPLECATEPGVFRDLAQVLPEESTVFAGNSMPVRDMDTFFAASSKRVRVLASRGVSGIDGVTSAALGAAAVSPGRLVLVIGDLSFYHDMNGLLAAGKFEIDATIVLVNNDGGGIFSFLSQHDQPEYFERLFGTPHGLDFRPVAELYRLHYSNPLTPHEYRQALLDSFDRSGVSLIEVKTDREENLALHGEVMRRVAESLRGLIQA